MSNLQDRLDVIRTVFETRVSPEALEVMHRATEDLKASGIEERALGEGVKAPAFSLPDQHGTEVASAELLVNGPTVVSFFRGHWSPYCIAELDALNKCKSEFNHAGASLVAISPQTHEMSRAMIKERGLQFPILRDMGNLLAAAYGLRRVVSDELKKVYLELGLDIAASNGDQTWSLPMPARYVIDPAGMIAYASFDADHTKRPDPEETLEALQRL